MRFKVVVRRTADSTGYLEASDKKSVERSIKYTLGIPDGDSGMIEPGDTEDIEWDPPSPLDEVETFILSIEEEPPL